MWKLTPFAVAGLTLMVGCTPPSNPRHIDPYIDPSLGTVLHWEFENSYFAAEVQNNSGQFVTKMEVEVRRLKCEAKRPTYDEASKKAISDCENPIAARKILDRLWFTEAPLVKCHDFRVAELLRENAIEWVNCKPLAIRRVRTPCYQKPIPPGVSETVSEGLKDFPKAGIGIRTEVALTTLATGVTCP